MNDDSGDESDRDDSAADTDDDAASSDTSDRCEVCLLQPRAGVALVPCLMTDYCVVNPFRPTIF